MFFKFDSSLKLSGKFVDNGEKDTFLLCLLDKLMQEYVPFKLMENQFILEFQWNPLSESVSLICEIRIFFFVKRGHID